jgi:hypothetical protein
MVDYTVANEIKNQLGHKTLYMLGAKNLVADNDSLTFKIRGSKEYTHIKIAINGKDLYNVSFYKCSVKGISKEQIFNDVFVDDLHKLIEDNTKLYTKLF